MFHANQLNRVAQAALTPETGLVIRKSVMPTRNNTTQSSFNTPRALYQGKIATKRASGALNSATSISRDLQREGKIAPNTEGATQLLLSRFKRGKAQSTAIPAILRLPEAQEYSQLRPQALQMASKVPPSLLKRIALLKKVRKLQVARLAYQQRAAAKGDQTLASVFAVQARDAAAQASSLETSIMAISARSPEMGDAADYLARVAELEGKLEALAETALCPTDQDLMDAGAENSDMSIMEDAETSLYLEEASKGPDATAVFSDDDPSALLIAPEETGLATMYTTKNLLILTAAAGLGYVLFLRN
jgi:hypothetical protein